MHGDKANLGDDGMQIQMTKSDYAKRYCFEEKIPQGILEKHEFLPEPPKPIDLSWLDNEPMEIRIEMEVEESDT